MKLIRTALLILSCLTLAVAALAQSPTPPSDTILKQLKTDLKSDAIEQRGKGEREQWGATAGKVDEKAPGHFNAGDFDLSLYGKGSIDIRSRSKQDLDYGGGLGGTYWLTRGLGIGGLAELGDFNHSVIDHAAGRITVRAPLWDTVAPYGFADGGYDFERERWLVEAGGGGELRFAQGWGIFLEAGLGTSTRGEAYGVARAGVRLTAF